MLPDGKIRVVRCRPELVSGHEEEDEGGGLLEHVVQPLVLVRRRDLQQVDNDPINKMHHIEVGCK